MEQAKPKRGRKAAENAAPSSVQVLDRSLKLLALIAENDGSTLTDLADASGMAPSTVHRLLSSLSNHGMVSHDAESGDWTIGVKAFEIGNAFRRFRKLGTLARPYLKQLMEASGKPQMSASKTMATWCLSRRSKAMHRCALSSARGGADRFMRLASARLFFPHGRIRRLRAHFRAGRWSISHSGRSTQCPLC